MTFALLRERLREFSEAELLNLHTHTHTQMIHTLSLKQTLQKQMAVVLRCFGWDGVLGIPAVAGGQTLAVPHLFEDGRPQVHQTAVLGQNQPRPRVTLRHVQRCYGNSSPHL